MSKRLLSLMTVVLMSFVVCAGFVACSSDDEEGGGGSSAGLGEVSSEIVGTWYGSVSHAYMTITFYADGTGRGSRTQEYYSGDMMSHNEYTFSWGRQGNKVNVRGYRAGVDDEGNENNGEYSDQFNYMGGRLLVDEVNGKWYGGITAFTKQ